MARAEDRPFLTVRGLTKHFSAGLLSRKERITAVDGMEFDLRPGECLGLVGESGSGKTTTARCVLRLIDPTSGEVTFEGVDVVNLRRRDVRGLYRHMQMVFQDPNSSLNPRMTVKQMITEPLKLHMPMPKAQRMETAVELVHLVGLSRAHLDRYPAQLSGGQRQRVGIARAIATHPKVVFLDEPTSSLDVSVRGQILKLLLDLQQELNMSYVLISHDLGVVRQLCDRVLVMYRGRVVEKGSTRGVFDAPHHEYTRRLLAAIPSMDGYRHRRSAEVVP